MFLDKLGQNKTKGSSYCIIKICLYGKIDYIAYDYAFRFSMEISVRLNAILPVHLSYKKPFKHCDLNGKYDTLSRPYILYRVACKVISGRADLI